MMHGLGRRTLTENLYPFGISTYVSNARRGAQSFDHPKVEMSLAGAARTAHRGAVDG